MYPTKRSLAVCASGMAMVCSIAGWATLNPEPARAKAPLYVYVPEISAAVPCYGRLGADIDKAPNGGLVITHVVPDSPAEKMTLHRGDQIKTIDGQKIQSLEDAIRVLDGKGVTETTVVAVDREGTEMTFSGPLAPDYEIEAHRHVRHTAKVTPSIPAGENPVTNLTLDVPPDARVYLNGKLMRTIGYLRPFDTKALATTQRYKDYPVRVEVDRDGRTLSQDRTIDVVGGQTHHLVIYFDAPTARVARR